MFNQKKLRLGLCCIFRDEDIRFRTRQAGYVSRYPREQQLDLLSTSILHNVTALLKALEYCAANQIGSFRVNSRFFPLKSHPDLHYTLEELPEYGLISELLVACKTFGRNRNIRLTLHPDQFTLLSSPRENVTRQSFYELQYHADLAALVGADVITLHGGGAYGDKRSALLRVGENIDRLPENVRQKLALENDDRVYTPSDLLPLCQEYNIPLVYDVHHHRCLEDGLTIQEATVHAFETWNREPVFHISSPKNGWGTRDIRSHHDFIDQGDFPELWQELEITVEVEAKAKEVAVKQLQQSLQITEQAA